MNKDTIKLINHSTSTFLNIAQMAQYRVGYVLNKDAADKEKMYKHAFLSRSILKPATQLPPLHPH